jgi:hypothetical protein
LTLELKKSVRAHGIGEINTLVNFFSHGGAQHSPESPAQKMVAMSLDERRDNQEFSRSLSAEFAKSTQTLSDEKADLTILNFRRRSLIHR